MAFHRISGSQNGFEVIQQWQYIDPVSPELLRDAVFNYCKEFGITSLQSYVTWAEIEKKPGRLNYSIYDALVDKILKHNLKWIPFLILGPHYATPKWFQESEHNLYAKCLEHGRSSKIQSIWNPHLPEYVEHFLSRFAEHYKDPSIFESIALGISGNWGEAIFPATGCFLGGFHSHPGWWCGDEYAIESFRQFAAKKYATVSMLNHFWSTNFNYFSDVSFPSIERSLTKDLFYQLIKIIPKNQPPELAFRYRL